MIQEKRPKTLGLIVVACKGAPGSDFLRVSLSTAIFIWHCVVLAIGRKNVPLEQSLAYPIVLALVPLFFALSGFLVLGSAMRTRSVKVFLTFRSLRIFPALVTEILLSAFLLGPAITIYYWRDYFIDRDFFKYFGNLVGKVHFVLPGVFELNPLPRIVNGNLWTLTPEFYCYLIIAALMLLSIVYSRKMFTILFVVITAGACWFAFTTGYGNPRGPFPTPVVVYSFLTGMLFFHWRDNIPISWALLTVCAVLSYFLLKMSGMAFVAVLPLTYVLCFLLVTKFPKIPLLNRGDYSYGIYLYGFPIQQALVHFFPEQRHWLFLFVVGYTLTCLFAAGSWHVIEKPALRLKSVFLKQKPARVAVVN